MTTAINLAALGFGGMDTSTLVTSLVNIDAQPLNQLAQTQAQVQSAQSTISSFATALSSLSTAATSLADPVTFAAMAATSSDSTLGATATGSPAAGQWSVSVSAIAQAQRTISSGISSSSQALGLSGTLSIQIGSGAPAQIAVSATDTLSDVSNSIAAAGLRVQSSLTFDGSQYHLLVSGLDTGAANSVTFDESGLSSSGGYSLGLSAPTSTLQKAQDAQLTVGGLAVTSASNQVTNAIPGVTLNLTQKTTTPATISIQGDSTSIASQVQSFVTSYNLLVTQGHNAAGFGTQKASNLMLQGDTAVRTSLSSLAHLLSQQVPGTTGSYTTLASVGVKLNTDGTLALDSGKLTTALATDPTSVRKLFVTDPTTGSTGVMGSVASAITGLTSTNGSVHSEISAFQSRVSSIGKQMTQLQLQVTNYQTQLQTEFTQMNKMLSQYKQMAASITSFTNPNGTNNSSNNVL